MGIEALAAVFSPLVRLVGFVIPPLNKILAQPKLYIILNGDGVSQRAGVLSAKNDSTAPIIASQAIYHFDLSWGYKLTVRNNSGLNAYNLKLLNPKGSAEMILHSPIDGLKPLLANTEVEYTISIKEKTEGTSKESGIIMQSSPAIIRKQKFVLEYTNERGVKYYTVFTYDKSNSQNQFFSAYDFDLLKPYIVI